MRAVYANCFPPSGLRADVLLTDEPVVATAARERSLPTASPELEAASSELADQISVEIMRLAFSWFLRDDLDDTIVHGVSVGDLAGVEAAIAVLMPAARAALSMAAALSARPQLTTLVIVAPVRTPDGRRYDELEGLAAQAACATARHLSGDAIEIERVASAEPGNALLRDKYARTRDPDLLITRTPSRALRALALSGLNGMARLRRRPGRSLLVVEYNPTAAFSRAYAAGGTRRRLVRWVGDPREVIDAVRRGDLIQAPPMLALTARSTEIGERLRAHSEALRGAKLSVAGVPLWPLVAPRLFELVERYAGFAATASPRLSRQLARNRVAGVLVPFDYVPPVRLLVRLAQARGIPTFTLSDGYKADRIQQEGMSTDVALAWSTALRDHYFDRSSQETIVTGNPKFSTARRPRTRAVTTPRQVLIGTFTFSPFDLNCRRADPEQFLDEVLEGVAAAVPAVSSTVLVKLHPADEPAHYRELVACHPSLQIDLRTHGDVAEMFDMSDVYVTTYSTSLLEAARAMPVVYYRVNEQQLGAPFRDDEFLGPRTASSPSELTRLLRDSAILDESAEEEWVERFLGPDGAVQRVSAAIESKL